MKYICVVLQINTLRRFTEKVERLFGVKVVLTAVVPGIEGEEAQELIQVSSKHRKRDEAEKAEVRRKKNINNSPG